MKFITYFCVHRKTLRLICIRKTDNEANEHSNGGFKIFDFINNSSEEERGRVILYNGKETDWIKNNFKY